MVRPWLSTRAPAPAAGARLPARALLPRRRLSVVCSSGAGEENRTLFIFGMGYTGIAVGNYFRHRGWCAGPACVPVPWGLRACTLRGPAAATSMPSGTLLLPPVGSCRLECGASARREHTALARGPLRLPCCRDVVGTARDEDKVRALNAKGFRVYHFAPEDYELLG